MRELLSVRQFCVPIPGVRLHGSIVGPLSPVQIKNAECSNENNVMVRQGLPDFLVRQVGQRLPGAVLRMIDDPAENSVLKKTTRLL